MRKLIILLTLLALNVTAEPIWFSGRQDDWEKKKNEGLYRAVAVLNYCTTNEVVTTNGTYYVTNYVHTAENTNNALWQINFSYTNSTGDNCWIMGYDTRKIFFDIDLTYQELYDFCTNNKKFQCGRGMGLTEYKAIHGYGDRTNQWLTLSIPFVDDAKKADDREKQFKKEKKKE